MLNGYVEWNGYVGTKIKGYVTALVQCIAPELTRPRKERSEFCGLETFAF